MRDTRPFAQQGWHPVATDPPPERVVVEVSNNGGTTLLLDRGLWWFPDHSMYVYYSPEWWRRYAGVPGADPEGTCSHGCWEEPSCITDRPLGGWPYEAALFGGDTR